MIPWGLPLNERSVGFSKEMVASRRSKRRVGPSCPARKTMKERSYLWNSLWEVCEVGRRLSEFGLRLYAFKRQTAVIMKPTRICHRPFRYLERKLEYPFLLWILFKITHYIRHVQLHDSNWIFVTHFLCMVSFWRHNILLALKQNAYTTIISDNMAW